MDKVLIEKYLKDQCTPAETEQVLEWLQTPEGQEYLKEEIEQDIRVFEQFGEELNNPEPDSDKLFNRILATKTGENDWEKNSRSSSNFQWKKAASVLLLVGLLSLFVIIFIEMLEPEKRIVETKLREQKTLLLPDSSKIILHSNSRLEYRPAFEKREVSLEGVAYFEVEHLQDQSFKVFIEDSYIKVLGTKFVVSGYSGSERVEVAVKKGRVEMGSKGLNNGQVYFSNKPAEVPSERKNKKIEISTDEVGVQNKNSTPFISDSTFSNELFDWMEGKMIFRSTPLRRVFNELENRFGVQFQLQNQDLGQRKFTSSFDNESLEEVLNVLTISFNVSYHREGDKIHIKE